MSTFNLFYGQNWVIKIIKPIKSLTRRTKNGYQNSVERLNIYLKIIYYLKIHSLFFLSNNKIVTSVFLCFVCLLC